MNTERFLTLGRICDNMGGPMMCRLRKAGHGVGTCGLGRRGLSPFAADADAA